MKAVFVLALLVAAVAGCSSAPPPSTTPILDEEGRYVIHLTAGNRFVPALATIPANASVVWVNDAGASATPHDVQSDDRPQTFSSGAPGGLKPGSSYVHQFASPGTYTYACHLHEQVGMKATLVVA